MIDTTRSILEHAPASFRAVAPNLRGYMRNITLSIPVIPSEPSTSTAVYAAPPLEARQSAAELIAALPLTAGKAQSSAAWGVAIREAIGGMSEAMGNVVRDGFDEGEPLAGIQDTELTIQNRPRSFHRRHPLVCLSCRLNLLSDFQPVWIGSRVSMKSFWRCFGAQTTQQQSSYEADGPVSRTTGACPCPSLRSSLPRRGV
jgi:hypothetical protein